MNSFPGDKQVFAISGVVGDLEVATSVGEQVKPVTCIVCHPHPQQGGTMHNKVVYTLASTVNELGIKAVRFNYRGVQNSDGEFDHGVGELEDLLCVYEWVKTVCPDDEVWLAGFSFGGFISLKGFAEIPNVKQVISISPPAGHPYFYDIPAITSPWVLVQGEEDDVVLPNQVYDWVDSLETQKPELIKVPETGHFFHRKLTVLKQVLKEALEK